MDARSPELPGSPLSILGRYLILVALVVSALAAAWTLLPEHLMWLCGYAFDGPK
jgi:hypothetical protein